MFTKLFRRCYAESSIEVPPTTLYTYRLIALQSHKTSSSTSHQTLKTIPHSQCPSSIWCNSIRKLPSLIRPSFVTKTWLMPTKMKKPLPHHPWLGCPQTFGAHHMKTRKSNRKRRDLFPSLNPCSHPNRLARNTDPTRTISMPTKTVKIITVKEE